MDKHPEVNWSKTCRDAIEACISILENPSPKLRAELREVRLSYARDKPGLNLDLIFKNEMLVQLMLDRMLFEVNFVPTPGTQVSVATSSELRKHVVPIGKWVMFHFVEVDPEIILHINEQLTRTFQCTINIVGFFDGFQDAYTESLSLKIPIDEWQRFVEHVLKIEKEKMKIREERLSRIST